MRKLTAKKAGRLGGDDLLKREETHETIEPRSE